MSHLTEEGKKLYNEYINGKNAWREYIRNIATESFNKRFNDLGKKYYKYSYFGYIINNLKDDKKQMSDKTKKIYHKLSILFHPDKYTKSDKIFIIITSCANKDEYNILELIDGLSSDILECPEILMNELLQILNDKYKLNNLYQYMQKENSCFINYIAGNILDEEINILDEETNSCCSDFLNTNIYAWFMGNDKVKKGYESSYYNEEELIEHLKGGADEDEIKFYCETSNSERIKFVANSVLKSILEERNNHLKTENIIPHIINQIDSLKYTDELYAYQISNILNLINDTNKNLLK